MGFDGFPVMTRYDGEKGIRVKNLKRQMTRLNAKEEVLAEILMLPMPFSKKTISAMRDTLIIERGKIETELNSL